MNRLRKTLHGVRHSQSAATATTSERAWPANDDAMSERRRPSGRRNDRNNNNNNNNNSARVSGKERRGRRSGGGVGESGENANDNRRSGGREGAASRRRRRPPQVPPAPTQQQHQKQHLRRSSHHQQQQSPNGGIGTAMDNNIPNHSLKNNGNDNCNNCGRRSKNKKEIQSSVLAAIDSVEAFQTKQPSPATTSRIKHTKHAGGPPPLVHDFADFAQFEPSNIAAATSELQASAKQYRRSASGTSDNPNSRRRRGGGDRGGGVGGRSKGGATANTTTTNPGGGTMRTAKNNHPSNVPSPQPTKATPPPPLIMPTTTTTPTKRSPRKLFGDGVVPSMPAVVARRKSPRKMGRPKSPFSGAPSWSSSALTERRGGATMTTEKPAVVLPERHKSPNARRLRPRSTPKRRRRRAAQGSAASDVDVGGGTMPSRLRDDLRTRRRRALDVTCVCNADGSVELDVPGLGSADPGTVYRSEPSPSDGGGSGDNDDGEGGRGEGSSSKRKKKKSRNGVGTNGWHRALAALAPPRAGEGGPGTGPLRPARSTEASTAGLDQLTATHVLQHVHPQLNEYDAVREEYEYLLKEIRSLEKDRVTLERQFHEAGRVSGREVLKAKNLTYSKFRKNLRYMKGEDVKALPVVWLEDVPLSMPDGAGGQDGNNSNNNNNNRKLYAKLDKPFQDLIRDHRGVGLALLIADPQCKTSLIGQCYKNSNMSSGRVSSHRSAMLKREKAATLIDEGGEWLKHCAITGFDNETAANRDNAGGADGKRSPTIDPASLGTTYFLKFDNGRTHHRGDLPANLAGRLIREGKERGDIAYLSTGCSYNATGRKDAAALRGHRCYYAEFDNGECWWGTNKDDVLDGLLMETDVHRVAFGSGGPGGNGAGGGADPSGEYASSWIVLGKDGTVKWKNVPQGLHDALIGRDAGLSVAVQGDREFASFRNTASAPCEVSLGIGGTYFVRFLDGRVDYSLPNFAADVFDKFEADGKLIRDVALHVDTYDCLIRYSKGGVSGDESGFSSDGG